MRPPIAVIPLGKTEITFTRGDRGWHFHRWRTTGRRPADIVVHPADRELQFESPSAAVTYFRERYADRFKTEKK